jgi:serine/threonine-protein kinase
MAREVDRAAAAFTEAQREVVVWEGRSGFREPYKQLADAYRACAEAVDAWHVVRRQQSAAQKRIENKERAVGDLDYQIAELRQALAAHEKAIEGERAAAERKIIDLNENAERLQASLLQLASKFCEPLRARPELGPLFQELESDAA